MALEFYQRAGRLTDFGSAKDEELFMVMLKESGVGVLFELPLESVTKEDGKIAGFTIKYGGNHLGKPESISIGGMEQMKNCPTQNSRDRASRLVFGSSCYIKRHHETESATIHFPRDIGVERNDGTTC